MDDLREEYQDLLLNPELQNSLDSLSAWLEVFYENFYHTARRILRANRRAT